MTYFAKKLQNYYCFIVKEFVSLRINISCTCLHYTRYTSIYTRYTSIYSRYTSIYTKYIVFYKYLGIHMKKLVLYTTGVLKL